MTRAAGVRIAVVAGELSGDMLGAGLIAALREHFPEARFEGIGGERMQSQGFESLFALERLSVMGLVEVLGRLRELLRIRATLHRRYLADPPDVFIGIDAPDFNLPLERRLRAAGIRTVHYVSPSVWAWRQRRVRDIARSVDLMLTLLPFEAAFYREHRVPVCWVGHPLADEIPWRSERTAARRALGLAARAAPGYRPPHLIAILPGSRLGEVEILGPLFLDTARWLRAQRPELGFVVPAATARIAGRMRAMLAERAPDLPVTLVDGRSREVIAAADAILLASGTATLEAALLKRPMVVAYKVAPVTAWIAARLLKISRFSLPNLLLGRDLVREFIQQAATVENLGPAVLELLDDMERSAAMVAEFDAIHAQLRRNASAQAAAAIAELIARPRNAARARRPSATPGLE